MHSKTFNGVLVSMLVDYLDKMSGYGNGYPNYEIEGVQLNEDTIDHFTRLDRKVLDKLAVKIYSDYISAKAYFEQEDVHDIKIPF